MGNNDDQYTPSFRSFNETAGPPPLAASYVLNVQSGFPELAQGN